MADAEAPSIDRDEAENDQAAADEARLAKFWIAEILGAEKHQAKWVERAKKVEKLYTDERDASANRTRRFNVLWSNVETQRPAIFMHTPTPRAVRRYAQKDPVARFTALLIERALQVSCDQYNFDEEVDQAVRDRLVPGRGQMWVFYDPVIEGDGDEEVLAYEAVTAEYLPWQDFLHSVARTWREVWWVGRRFYKTRRELRAWLKERGLDPRKAEKVKLDFSVEGDKGDEGLRDERNKAIIWEIHNKRDKQVLYVAPGSGNDAIIGRQAPAVRFRDFFPCPMPMLATTSARSLIPTPDYVFYQDQAAELDELTARIGLLQKALKVAGVYNKNNKELASLLTGSELKMVAVDDWAMFAESGGVKGNIEWFPVEVVAAVIEKLYLAREQAKQTLYEVSGIGDILRGATDPDETATAQGIKAKWGSLRQRRNQKRSTSFLDQVFQLKAEVICQLFDFQTILEMAGVDDALLEQYAPKVEPPSPPQGQPPDPTMAQRLQQQHKIMQMQARTQFLTEVEKLLRNDVSRTFRITVQPDSMLEPDRQEEKQTAVEFLTAISMFMEKAGPLATQGPEAADVVGSMLMFGVRRFDKVDELEEKIEAFVEAMKRPRPPQPDPEMVKAQAKVEETKVKIAGQKEMQAAKIEGMRAEQQVKMQGKALEVAVDAQVKQAQAQMQMEQQAQQHEVEMQQGAVGFEQKMSQQERQAAFERLQRDGAPPA